MLLQQIKKSSAWNQSYSSAISLLNKMRIMWMSCGRALQVESLDGTNVQFAEYSGNECGCR